MRIFIVVVEGVPHSSYAIEKQAMKAKEGVDREDVRVYAVELYGLDTGSRFDESPFGLSRS